VNSSDRPFLDGDVLTTGAEAGFLATCLYLDGRFVAMMVDLPRVKSWWGLSDYSPS